MKKLAVASALLLALTVVPFSNSASAQTLSEEETSINASEEIVQYYDPEGPNSVYNYVTNKEKLQYFYKGYIQFKPSYKVPRKGGYGLTTGRRVKRAYINYTRDGVSLTGGRVYTGLAKSNTNNNIYKVSREVKDTLNPIAPKTVFNWGWQYF